jgi:hypothetical protein
LPLAHSVLARELQDSAVNVIAVEGVGVGSLGTGELETDAVGEFLLVEVGSVWGSEVGEVEFLAGAGLRLALLLRGWWWGEVQVAGFVEREPAAFPELLVGSQYGLRRREGFRGWRTYQSVRELHVQIAHLDSGWCVSVKRIGRCGRYAACP